ncbi:DUF1697 domain-containing protein [Paenibacillus pinihumi]|uniref:DUF1697 domain-containing protein n=1 Tax=Paenibacillus pinihumi TaxID=669462 RepID=UPI00042A0E73|nr:DUF1697 domain-containing protein [Paenibacillus pinihumi]
MTIQVALLKGINVGGKNKIKMTELKQLMEQQGFRSVHTYINSGNVLFESDETESLLSQRIEQLIADGFGLSIKVIIRTSGELETIIRESPYRTKAAPDGKNVHVGLMEEAPSQEASRKLEAYKFEDEFAICGRELHILLNNGAADSKLANNVQKLSPNLTLRNWNTMNKLVILAKSIQP